jgi:hypothetical protein
MINFDKDMVNKFNILIFFAFFSKIFFLSLCHGRKTLYTYPCSHR